MQEIDDINGSFIETLTKSDLSKVAMDIAEVGFDVFLKEGPLKEVPVIGCIVGVYNGIVSVRDKFFMKKVLLFLTAIREASQTEREQMFDDLEKGGRKREEVCESILITLDKVESYKAAQLLGILLNSFKKSVISYDDFERFSSFLTRSYIKDILALPTYIKEKESRYGSLLEAYGLIQKMPLWRESPRDSDIYCITKLGLLLCKALDLK
jgi:hypothetical protein